LFAGSSPAAEGFAATGSTVEGTLAIDDTDFLSGACREAAHPERAAGWENELSRDP
jgi:hypothetical protein